MKVNGRDIGGVLDSMYQLIAGRVGTSGRELRIVPLDEGAEGLSDVQWTPKRVTIGVHTAVPTYALPHVVGIALQHVRQSLDGYPSIGKPKGRQPEGSDLVRAALRELVLEPDAEAQLNGLALERKWENEQRHEGMKQLLKAPPADWDEEGSLGNLFIGLQYARMALTHPPEMWTSLERQVRKALPVAAATGERALSTVKRRRWGSANNVLNSYLLLREELELEDMVLIEDGAGNPH